MPGGQKLNLELSPFWKIPTEKTFKFRNQTPVHELLWGAAYEPACVQLMAKPTFAIHQGLALSTF